MGPSGESPAVVARQPQAPPADLPLEKAIFFDQIRERLPLATIKPPDDGQEQQPKDGHVDHERELISQTDEPVGQTRSSRGTLRGGVIVRSAENCNSTGTCAVFLGRMAEMN